MSGLDEIEAALDVLRGRSDVVVLQCTSRYPCPPEDVNLRALESIRRRFDVPVGLSDHTPGIYTGIAAVALGAVCVEKHFTLSKRLYGPDHHASLVPEEFEQLARGVREVEAALGDGDKRHDPELDPVRATFEKSVVTRAAITAGTEIQAAMLTTKRPGTGIPATKLHELVGRRAARDLPADELLQAGDVV
jgi:sialic acid synthase SpsE